MTDDARVLAVVDSVIKDCRPGASLQYLKSTQVCRRLGWAIAKPNISGTCQIVGLHFMKPNYTNFRHPAICVYRWALSRRQQIRDRLPSSENECEPCAMSPDGGFSGIKEFAKNNFPIWFPCSAWEPRFVLKVYGVGKWKVRKHGIGKRRMWRKLYVMVDDQEAIAVVAADGAYDAMNCH